MTGHKVLVVGDIIRDIIAMPEGPIVRGSDRRAKIRMRPGGSGANQAAWLAHFRVPVRFAGRVNAGDLDTYHAHFLRLGVEPVLAADAEAPSGVLISIVDTDGERSFLTDRGANLNLSEADLPPRLLDDVRLLMISGYCFFTPGPRAAVMALLKAARDGGIATAVDPASVGFLREVGAEAFLKWTAGVDTIFANLDEALALTGASELGLQMQTLGRFYGRVVVKRGVLGAAIGNRRGTLVSLPAPRGEVVDTTGAGDAFAAAFVAREIEGADAETCLRAGIEAGAEAIALIGGQPSA